MKGYIKDYRKELHSDIWLMPPLYHRVWQWLKYQVNHGIKEIPMKDGTKLKIEKGQHLTSVRNISQGVGWYEGARWKEPNPKTITVILDWLIQNQMIDIDRGKGNRQFTLITLLNWECYQSKDEDGNSKVTRNGEGRKHETDINKNVKNDLKNDKNERIKTYTNDPLLIEALIDFEKMRKGIKAPLTDRAYTLLFNQLDKLAKNDEEKIEILNQSIMNSWKGIFALKKGVQNESIKTSSRKTNNSELDEYSL